MEKARSVCQKSWAERYRCPFDRVDESLRLNNEEKNLLEDHFEMEHRIKCRNGFSNRRFHFKVTRLGLIDAVFWCGCVFWRQWTSKIYICLDIRIIHCLNPWLFSFESFSIFVICGGDMNNRIKTLHGLNPRRLWFRKAVTKCCSWSSFTAIVFPVTHIPSADHILRQRLNAFAPVHALYWFMTGLRVQPSTTSVWVNVDPFVRGLETTW